MLLKKIPKYIIDDLEIFSDSDIERSDEENLFEKSRWKKILIIEKILIRKFWKKFGSKKILMRKLNRYFQNLLNLYASQYFYSLVQQDDFSDFERFYKNTRNF